jgi:hypothetical protein
MEFQKIVETAEESARLQQSNCAIIDSEILLEIPADRITVRNACENTRAA